MKVGWAACKESLYIRPVLGPEAGAFEGDVHPDLSPLVTHVG